MKPLIIYHGACKDGFCAAWICSMVPKFKNAEYFPGFYGQPPPDVTDRDVTMIDFSYPRKTLEKMADSCNSFEILDHHKTAQEALEGFKHKNVKITFDMKRSGAGLAWDTFFPDDKRLSIVNYVEDRDIWKNKLPNNEEVSAWIGTIPFTFEAWSEAAARDEKDVLVMGSAALAKTQQYVRELVKNARRVDFEGYNIPIVNAPQIDISELLDVLRQGEKFAMGWWQRADGRFQYSLRSTGDFDVSELAKKHGGGGHKNAAGFESKGFIF